MIRELRYGIVLVAIIIVVGLASKIIDRRALAELRVRSDSLKLTAAATDVLVDQVRQRAAADSTRADSVEAANAALRRDLTAARNRSARVIVRVDSVRATIDEDTLTAGLRTLLAAEREVCKACAEERGLEQRRADKAESELNRIQPRFNSSRLLLFRVQAERDTALALVGDYQRQLNPGLFRRLFKDLPQKAACAAGGAAVAAINDGDVLLGAGIGLVACLVVEAML